VSSGAQPGSLARAARAAGIVLVFVLIGPPVGGLVFMISTALVGLGRDADVAGLTWVALFALIYAVPLSYFAGVVPAAAAGLLVGIRQAFFGPANWIYAVCVGLAIGAAMLVLSGQHLFDNDAPMAIILATCLVPTLVCWLIVRGWHLAHRLARQGA
jgi:hypothetical protein